MVTFATDTKTTRLLTIAGVTYPGYAWENAREQAKRKGIKVRASSNLANWQTTSASDPNAMHTVNGHCDCIAAQHDKLCMHLAAVRSAQMRHGLMRQCVVCHAWDYTERMEHVAENEYVCLECPQTATEAKPVEQATTTTAQRKVSKLEDLFRD